MKHFLLVMFIVLSCNTSSQTNMNDYLILNEFLKDKDNIYLVKENYFNGSTLLYFAMYEKWLKAELKSKDTTKILFNGKVEWIFSKEDTGSNNAQGTNCQ